MFSRVVFNSPPLRGQFERVFETSSAPGPACIRAMLNIFSIPLCLLRDPKASTPGFAIGVRGLATLFAGKLQHVIHSEEQRGGVLNHALVEHVGYAARARQLVDCLPMSSSLATLTYLTLNTLDDISTLYTSPRSANMSALILVAS